MRTGHLLFSAVHFFIVLLVLGLGLFFFIFSYADDFRFRVARFVEHDPGLFHMAGIAILGFGFILLTGFYLLNRRRFIRLKMDAAEVRIDESIIHDYIQNYWKNFTSEKEEGVEVIVCKGSILEVVVPMPKKWEGEIEDHLADVQDGLGDLLARHLGYKKEFYLTLTSP